MQVQYICGRINDLVQDIKDAKEFEDEEAFKHDLRGLRKLIKALSESAKEEREDGAFFEGELEDKEEPKQAIGAHVKEEKEDSCDKKNEDSCDHVEAFRKRRQKRLDAKEEEKGRWVTTENDHKVHLNEEGVPDKGNPFVLAVMSKKREPEKLEKKEPVSKNKVNQTIKEIVESEKGEDEKREGVKKEISKLRKGTKIIMPESWDDDGKKQTYTYDGNLWVSDQGWGSMSNDDMADYILTDDESERPKIKSIPRDEESLRKSREKRESKIHYAMNPNGSIDGHYTNDFHNDHVSQEDRDEFSKKIKERALYERGFDEERALYRTEAESVGSMVLDEIRYRASLRKGDKENAPINNRPQVEDIYDALRDIRDFGPPDGFDVKVDSEIDKERTDAIVKEALSRFPTDWFKDASHAPVIHIVDGEGRAYCANGKFITVYTKSNIGGGESVENNDRGLVNALAHELGHYIEDANAKVHASATDLLHSRGFGTDIVDVEPGYSGYKDSFFNTYMGKIYRGYGDVTEITSMLMGSIGEFDGIERMQGKEYDYMKGKWGRKATDKESLIYILGVLAGL